MSIWQRRIATSPEERGAERIRDLERGLAASERNRKIPAMQRAKLINLSAAGVTATVLLGQLQFNVPSNATTVMLSYAGTVNVSAVGTSGQITWAEPTDFPAGVVLGSWSTVAPSTSMVMSGGGGGGVPAFIDGYTSAAPSPGTRTYSFYCARTGGAGTVAISSLYVTMLII